MEYDVNAQLIFEKELELARMLDWELRGKPEKLQKIRNFGKRKIDATFHEHR
jgi:hypothetical protein